MILNHINSILARVKPGTGNHIQYKHIESQSEINSLLQGQFSSAWHKYIKENVEIWRGTKMGSNYGDISIMTPGNRISQNVNNVYTRLMSDILPAWKEFPKRSQSFICSNSSGLAGCYTSGYGNNYLVLPENGAKLGICPEKDIWESFNKTLNMSLDMFNVGISDLVSKLKMFDSESTNKYETLRGDLEDSEEYFSGYDSTVTIQFLNELSSFITNSKKLDDVVAAYDKWNTPGVKYEKLSMFEKHVAHRMCDFDIKFIKDVKASGSVISVFDTMLNPNKNGITVTAINDLPDKLWEIKGGHEVWTDVPCLMLLIADQYSPNPSIPMDPHPNQRLSKIIRIYTHGN
jgi:hypothetical protein